MENTSFLAEVADNWMLVVMFTLFIGAILWALRPGSRDVHDETANIPFRNEDHPGSSETEDLQK
ncbi:CcoQ/FixQ family Cbb3-type cytochrome c oxidase assembly chaperone [Roseobacter sp. CCS2]|uniref:CcoQ/FixQ family Cbb3-type cytochrome c oxidase assembly chaperone n=1 Tax=Roseobacter sp. CCS2 TaxID=391593 RepID=UPI0000F40329|nr:CcoQ/FixQ family Cbb3-type cytochrome c oxidase assembly chaperone [Roseobacter sp. CCS2]EBA13367.1 Cbb3-type cytochrome oxidase component [Roseobacter sp. CCS2]